MSEISRMITDLRAEKGRLETEWQGNHSYLLKAEIGIIDEKIELLEQVQATLPAPITKYPHRHDENEHWLDHDLCIIKYDNIIWLFDYGEGIIHPKVCPECGGRCL